MYNSLFRRHCVGLLCMLLANLGKVSAQIQMSQHHIHVAAALLLLWYLRVSTVKPEIIHTPGKF